MPEIALQPKQSELLDLIRSGKYHTIGVGGGRGAAKSSGADRVLATLAYEQKDMQACLVMRAWPQLSRFHVERLPSLAPWLRGNLKASPPARLLIPFGKGASQIDYAYAQNYDDVEEHFRSGNYRYIVVDQAEQFTEREIIEMDKACRAAGKQRAVLILLFNMRGSGIQWLRKWFREKKVPGEKSPDDYYFLKVNPWDNVEWVRRALDEDGYTEDDYYAWTDGQRMRYAAERGDYTKKLATDDAAISAADWFGSWDSIEGAYFANQWDLESMRISPSLATALFKPWANPWLSQDWGKAHWCSSHWHFRITLPPEDVKRLLGWPKRITPLNLVVTYREMIVSELTSTEVARKLIDCTPEAERSRLKGYFLSPEVVTDDPNTIGSQQGKELRPYGMPWPTKADNDRKGGWALMAKLMLAAKNKGIGPDGHEYADAWLISSECVQALESIPLAMRDPKDLDDVLKTDKSQARLEQDVLDDLRYGLKTMLAPRKKTEEQSYQEQMAQAEPEKRMILAYRHEMKKQQKKRVIMPPSWKGNLSR